MKLTGSAVHEQGYINFQYSVYSILKKHKVLPPSSGGRIRVNIEMTRVLYERENIGLEAFCWLSMADRSPTSKKRKSTRKTLMIRKIREYETC